MVVEISIAKLHGCKMHLPSLSLIMNTFSIWSIVYFIGYVVSVYPVVTCAAVRHAITQKIKDDKEAFKRKSREKGKESL